MVRLYALYTDWPVPRATPSHLNLDNLTEKPVTVGTASKERSP
jgi:hypothetical protein